MQTINISKLLPMYATRQLSNEEWDFWIDNIVKKSQYHEKPFFYVGAFSIQMLFDSRYSREEASYVFQKLDKISDDLRVQYINDGNIKEFLDGIERLFESSVGGKSKDGILKEEIEDLKKFNPDIQTEILKILKEKYRWYFLKN